MKIRNRLIKLFRDNVNANTLYEIKTEHVAGEDVTEVYLYDAIGGFFGLSAEEFVKDLADIDTDKINLRINSPGGDVFEARAIATAIKSHKAHVTAHIDGLAASAATYIALAADAVRMADGALFMVHNAWTLAIGDKNDMLDTSALLEKIDGAIKNDYQKKTGLSAEEITEFMNAETWFNAEEAKEKGFIDEIYDGQPVENNYDLSAYEHAPEQVKQAEPEEKLNRDKFAARLRVYEKLPA